MRLRQKIFLLIAIAGLVLMILGVSGVFTRSSRRPPELDEVAAAGSKTEIVLRDFSVEEETWSLRAAEARATEEETLSLVKPVLESRREATDGRVLTLRVEADSGSYVKTPVQRISMSGKVRLEWHGEEDALLETESLEIEPDKEVGKAEGLVTVNATRADGDYVMSGEGVEFSLKQRTMTIQKNIRASGSGDMGLTAKKQAGDSSKMELWCKGPAIGDGFLKSVAFANEVRLVQGDTELTCDKLTAQFSETVQSPDRIVAEGNVKLVSPEATATADQVVRSATGNRLVLVGIPAMVQQGANRISSGKIELSLDSGGMTVPAAGELDIEQPGDEEKPGVTAKIAWTRMMQFSPEAHEVQVRGDVKFAQGEQVIECQTLTVTFDSENTRIIEARFEEKVRFVGVSSSDGGSGDKIAGKGASLLVDPSKQSFMLSGDAVVEKPGLSVTGERIKAGDADSISVAGKGRAVVAGSKEQQDGVDLSWTGGMSVNRESGDIQVQRGVGLAYGKMTLKADELTAKLSEGTRLDGFTATGNVIVSEPAEDAKGLREMRAGKVEAFGENGEIGRLRLTKNAIIEDRAETATRSLSANAIEIQLKKNRPVGMVAQGEALLVQKSAEKEQTLRADAISGSADAEGDLSAFVAEGKRVVLRDGKMEAAGRRLEWDAASESGVMTGEPVRLAQGGSLLYGDKITLLNGGETVRVTSGRRVEAAVR